MFYARRVGLVEDVAYPLKPPSSQATRSYPGKAKNYEPKALNETMFVACEEKEKYHHFTHPARDYTNSDPHFNKKEKMRR